jgi:hypothetical protein
MKYSPYDEAYMALWAESRCRSVRKTIGFWDGCPDHTSRHSLQRP